MRDSTLEIEQYELEVRRIRTALDERRTGEGLRLTQGLQLYLESLVEIDEEIRRTELNQVRLYEMSLLQMHEGRETEYSWSGRIILLTNS